MIKLFKKEIALVIHPTAYIFLALSMMLIIPNYPYYVIFFYTGLAIFFTCLNGRENNDILYSAMLPISKKEIVKSRFCLVILLEIMQILLAIPFAIIRQKMNVPSNQVGMEANIALFGFSLIMLGIFNMVFFLIYYKDVRKVGVAFVKSSIAVFLYIAIIETCVHIIPFFKNYLDTKDTFYITYKLLILGLGIIIYTIMTVITYKKAVKLFENYDI